MNQYERFEFYAKRGRGTPVVDIVKFKKNANVNWYEADLWDEHTFKREVSDELCQKIRDIWERNIQTFNRRSTLINGKFGIMYYVPHKIAEEVFNVVKGEYSKALKKMLDNNLTDRDLFCS